MSKIRNFLFAVVFVLLCVDYSFSQSFDQINNINQYNSAQSSSQNSTLDSDNNGIRDGADSVIAQILTGNNFSPVGKEKSALQQFARSYEYILKIQPSTQDAAYQASLRDVAAVNCLSSRLNDTNMDTISTRIENYYMSNPSDRNIYDRYISLLNDGDNRPSTAIGCEDQYSGSSQSGPSSSGNTNIFNTSSNVGGGVQGNNVNIFNSASSISSLSNMPCLVLNRFMEQGSMGEQVTKLQTFLVVVGDLQVWPTGYFGPNTATAVKRFQNRYDLDSRYAWVGPSTRGIIARLTCNGDEGAMAAARKGISSVKVRTTSTKVNTVQVATEPVPDMTNIPPANNTTPDMVLSSTGGVFDLTRNPVNTLYFTAKADVKNESVYVCIERPTEQKCYSSLGYSLVNNKYDPKSFDSVANNDRWIFTIYYTPSMWGKDGGKIYIKRGQNGNPSIYNVGVRQ